jgi:hypothetical protein
MGVARAEGTPAGIRHSTEPIVPAVPIPKTLREHISQFAAKKDGLTKTERRRANTWRSLGQEHIDDFQREDFYVFRKHLASAGKYPRTQSNLLGTRSFPQAARSTGKSELRLDRSTRFTSLF